MPKPNLQDRDVTPASLPTGRVDVWSVSLAAGPDRAERVWDSLSPDEQARAARFKFERDRRRFVVGRGALRSILAAYLGRRPGEVRFTYGEHGKPMLAESIRVAEFNASGSDELAVCAVTVGRPVGIDIELCRPIDDDALVEQCLAPAERAAYRALPPEKRSAAFCRLWTLKEAYLKATGSGLSRPLSSLELACLPGEQARLAADDQAPCPPESWTFTEFSPGANYAGALVIAGPGRPVEHRQWSFDVA